MRRVLAVFAAAAMLLLCSCSFEAFGYRFYVEPIEEADDPNVWYYNPPDESGEKDEENGDYAKLIRENGMEYVWESIADLSVKANVGEVIRAMANLEEDIVLPNAIPVDEVWTFVHFVHDYICGFTHVEYYTYSYWSDEQGDTAYAIRLKYTKDAELAKKELSELNKKVDEIVAEAPEGEYDKVKYFHDYICRSCEYDSTCAFANCGNAYGALIDGYAVCQGYAHAMQLLLSRAGFDAVTVIGTVGEGYHKWNYVKLSDGNWYAIDATWDDTDKTDGKDMIYTYFLVSDAELKRHEHSDAYAAAYFTMPSAKKNYKVN